MEVNGRIAIVTGASSASAIGIGAFTPSGLELPLWAGLLSPREITRMTVFGYIHIYHGVRFRAAIGIIADVMRA
jgi:hypothetical protein